MILGRRQTIRDDLSRHYVVVRQHEDERLAGSPTRTVRGAAISCIIETWPVHGIPRRKESAAVRACHSGSAAHNSHRVLTGCEARRILRRPRRNSLLLHYLEDAIPGRRHDRATLAWHDRYKQGMTARCPRLTP